MTENSSPRPDVQLDAESTTAPFLTITGSYPAGDGEYTTIRLEMNPGPDDEVDDDGAEIRSWFTDLCTRVIRELRQAPAAQTVVLTGRGVTEFLADRVVHAEGCDGTCGQPAGEVSADNTEQSRQLHRQHIVNRAYGLVDPDGRPTAAAQSNGGA